VGAFSEHSVHGLVGTLAPKLSLLTLVIR